MSPVLTIARRELKAQFDQPTGYVLLVVFLAITAFFFFRNAYLANTASLRPMLDLLPWVFLFFVPAVAMRSLAEDNRGGMLEIVLAQPLSEAQLVLGKYLGVLFTLFAALGSTLLIPAGLALGSALPWGPVIAQYSGAALLAAGFAGVGVWASSITRSQITAFILAVAVMFLLILVGLDPLLVGLPPSLGGLAARLGVLTHFESIGRGVLDLRDVLYFVSLAAVFLALAYAGLMNRRLPRQGAPRQRLRLGTALSIAVLVALNLAGGLIGGRLDLTPGNAYTLSPATRNLARGLDDIATLKLFASKELPAEFGLVRRDVADLLRDLRAAGGGKLRVIQRDPGGDSAAAEEARSLGIQPVQFNVVGQAELSVREGFFGLAIQHAGRQEVIPFVERSDDLEYRVASAIRNLGRDGKPRLALIADQQAGSFQGIRAELSRSYDVESPALADGAPLGQDYAAVVIVAQRDSLSPGERSTLDTYLRGGGKLLAMESGMQVSNQGPFAMARPLTLNPVLAPYGVQINADMVYDLRANQMIGVPTGFLRVLRPYPYFLRAQSTRASPVNAELAELGLAWTSSLDTSQAKPGTITPLFVTTEAAGIASGMAMIDPAQAPPQADLATRLVAVQVTPGDSGGARLVVVGNSLLASDEMGRRSPENLVFVLNAVDWLAQDDALIAIRAKDRRPPPLVFESTALKQGVRYLSVAVLPLLIAGFGMLHLVRRRRLASRPYGGESSA